MSLPTPRLNRKRFVLVKQEGTIGTDSSPTSANGIYLESLTVKKMETKAIDRNSIRPFLGSGGKIISSYEGSIEMEIALAIGGDANGVPTPGTVPAWDVLMTGCGVAQYASTQAISGNAAAGTSNTLTLEAGSSSTNDVFCGTSVLVSLASNTCASGTADKLSFTLATADTSLVENDELVGGIARLTHTSGTLPAQPGVTVMNKQVILPVVANYINKTMDLTGCFLRVTTGSKNDIRKIASKSGLTVTLDKKLSALPTSSSTYSLIEERKIKSSTVATKVIELTTALQFAAATTTLYSIPERRLIINYDGSTKIATVGKPFSKTITTGIPYVINPFVRYYPISTAFKTNTIYYYEDGALHTFTGAMGTFTMDFSTGQLPTAKFTYTGIVDRYEDASLPTYDVSKWVEPVPVNFENTKDLIIGDYANTVTDKISFDAGNEVVHTNCPGFEAVYIKDRAVKGSVGIWAPKQSEMDFYELVKTGRKTVFAFTHGPIGNQIALFAQSVQLSNPSDSEKDGVQMLSLDLSMVPTSDGGDWQMVLQ